MAQSREDLKSLLSLGHWHFARSSPRPMPSCPRTQQLQLSRGGGGDLPCLAQMSFKQVFKVFLSLLLRRETRFNDKPLVAELGYPTQDQTVLGPTVSC